MSSSQPEHASAPIAPAGGAFDAQVNGYAGLDFNQDDVNGDALHACCQRLIDDGVAGILATVITERIELMTHRISRLAQLRERDRLVRSVIRGVHVEGPFLNPAPGYRGAHPEDAIRPADPEAMRALIDAGGGLVRLVTLAPEQDAGCKVTRWLADRGVVVSAGHTDASLDRLSAAVDAGLSMFTHLGNGCPATLPRHDNIVQRALALRDRLWLCFIADGVHVPFFALRNYLDLAGIDRAIVVTDAMAAAGHGPGRFRIGRWDLVVGEDLAVRSPDGSHLVGSAMTMRQARDNLNRHLDLDTDRIDRLTRINPLKALGLPSASQGTL